MRIIDVVKLNLNIEENNHYKNGIGSLNAVALIIEA